MVANVYKHIRIRIIIILFLYFQKSQTILLIILVQSKFAELAAASLSECVFLRHLNYIRVVKLEPDVRLDIRSYKGVVMPVVQAAAMDENC